MLALKISMLKVRGSLLRRDDEAAVMSRYETSLKYKDANEFLKSLRIQRSLLRRDDVCGHYARCETYL